jgi:hypothetical protein
MTPQVILFKGWYSPALCRAMPTCLFIFGDNLLGFGKGGQAIIRGQPNSFGIPTKRKPAMSSGSFFCDNSEADLDAVLLRLQTLWAYLESGQTIVIPVTENGDPSLGLERARLDKKAPTIYAAIKTHVREMCNAFGHLEIEDEASLHKIIDTRRS